MNPRGADRAQLAGAAAILLAIFATTPGCKRKHVEVDHVPDLPYPTCGAGELPPGEVVARGELRSGPNSLAQSVSETFEIRRRDCLYVATVRQEWPITVTDVDVVYDAQMLPLRVWRRTTVPGSPRPDGFADIRRYELRTPEVTIKHRSPDGKMHYEVLRGERPRAVVSAGRGLLTVWIQRLHLPVGGVAREWALDVRAELETLRVETLRREPDMQPAGWDRPVRVYTLYGRESFFADEHDVVLGDLAGLRPAGMIPGPAPAPMPMFGGPDPVHTP